MLACRSSPLGGPGYTVSVSATRAPAPRHDPSWSQLAQLSLTPLLQLSLTHLLQLLRYALPFLYEPFLQVRCRRHFALSRKSLREFRSLDCTTLLVFCSPRLSRNGREKAERIG